MQKTAIEDVRLSPATPGLDSQIADANILAERARPRNPREEYTLPLAWNGRASASEEKKMPEDEKLLGLAKRPVQGNRLTELSATGNTEAFGWGESTDPDLYKPSFLSPA